jgi:hypothetical protein
MGAVTKQEQLGRVDADLARGHTHPALQRLANLIGRFPDDLDIRAKRAAVNRQIGNPAEAGRWGYLSEIVTAEEVAAFERAFPVAAVRLRALKLSRDPAGRLGPLAAQRLRDLSRQAREPLPAPDRPLDTLIPLLGCIVLLVTVVAVIGLAVIGLLSLIR